MSNTKVRDDVYQAELGMVAQSAEEVRRKLSIATAAIGKRRGKSEREVRRDLKRRIKRAAKKRMKRMK